jgi:hypothetical protein
MKNNKKLHYLCTLTIASLTLFPASAAVITWGPPQNIAGDSDVLTNGTVVDAFAMSATLSSAITVNGVTFQQFNAPATLSVTHGNVTLSGTVDTVNGHDNTFGSASAPFATLSVNYQALLSSDANTTTDPTPDTLTTAIAGLTPGFDYEIEFWVNDSRGAIGPTRSETITGGPTLQFNTGAEGGVGQFIVGTFTADATTQSFGITGTPGSFVSQENALLVLATSPEPGSLALVALGAALTLGGLRKKLK